MQLTRPKSSLGADTLLRYGPVRACGLEHSLTHSCTLPVRARGTLTRAYQGPERRRKSVTRASRPAVTTPPPESRHGAAWRRPLSPRAASLSSRPRGPRARPPACPPPPCAGVVATVVTAAPCRRPARRPPRRPLRRAPPRPPPSTAAARRSPRIPPPRRRRLPPSPPRRSTPLAAPPFDPLRRGGTRPDSGTSLPSPPTAAGFLIAPLSPLPAAA